jgi:hypothetical protein
MWVTGDDIMIAGLILDIGGGADPIIVRGLGPSLAALGVPNWLPNPQLELRNSNGELIRSNNNWMDDPTQAALISAAGLTPGNAFEAAIVESLSPGTYTALLSGRANVTGIALLEVYGPCNAWTDTYARSYVDPHSPTPMPSQLTNWSARMMVQSGDGAAIAGFFMIGSGEFLVRGIGPSLSDFGVPNALPDPFLELNGKRRHRRN